MSGTVVTLAATPASGFTFAGWTGGACVGIEPCSVELDVDTSVQANFVPDSASDIVLVSALLPTSRSIQSGTTATVFATLINSSPDTTAIACGVQTASFLPASLSFQTTDPRTNALTATPDTLVDLQPGAAQSFVLSITPAVALGPVQMSFNFSCANAPMAAVEPGINTLLISDSPTPTPDIVALAATVENNGILEIPGAAGTGAFAVATANLGSAGAITASASVGSANLPIVTSICQTDPATSVCLAPPAASVTTTIDAGAEPTFAIFVQGKGTVPFQPAANRVFVQFMDASGAVRGSTSVAVRTQ